MRVIQSAKKRKLVSSEFRIHCRAYRLQRPRIEATALSTIREEFVSAAHTGWILGVSELISESKLEVALPILMEIDNKAEICQLTEDERSTIANTSTLSSNSLQIMPLKML